MREFLKKHSGGLIVGCFFLAAAMRLWMSSFGANFDMESFWLVGRLTAAGENFYAETTKFNYSPLFAYVFATLFELTRPLAQLSDLPDPFVFRFLVSFVLTLIDLGIGLLLLGRFKIKVCLLFLFNPVSVIITGYHCQFDNAAVLAGLGAFLLLERATMATNRIAVMGAAVLLGVSLGIKHVLFLAPFCLLLHTHLPWRTRLILGTVPYGVFGLFFVPYLDAWPQLIANVFSYQSLSNAPLLNALLPTAMADWISAKLIWVVGILAWGWWRRRQLMSEWFLEYLVVLVSLSPAMANQYLAIPSAAIARFMNPFFGAFALVAGYYLVGDIYGLRMADQLPVFPWVTDPALLSYLRNFDWMILLLAIGFLWRLRRKFAVGSL